jgi:hypothetical protein
MFTSSTFAGELVDPWTDQSFTVTATAPETGWDFEFRHGNLWIVCIDDVPVFVGCQSTGISGGLKGKEFTFSCDNVFKVIGQSFTTDYLGHYWTECTKDVDREFHLFSDESRSIIREFDYYYTRTTYYCWVDLIKNLEDWVNEIAERAFEKIIRSTVTGFTLFDFSEMLPTLYKQKFDTTGDLGVALDIDTELYMIIQASDNGIEAKGVATKLGGGLLYQLKVDYTNVYDWLVDLSESCLKRVNLDYGNGIATFTGIGIDCIDIDGGTTVTLSQRTTYDFEADPVDEVLNTVQSVPLEKVAGSINKFTANSNKNARNAASFNINHTLTNLPVIKGEDGRRYNYTWSGYIGSYIMYYNTTAGQYGRVHEKVLYDFRTSDSDDYTTITSVATGTADEDQNPSDAFKIAVQSGIPKITAETVLALFGQQYQTKVSFKMSANEFTVAFGRILEIAMNCRYSINLDDFNETGHLSLYSNYPSDYLPLNTKLIIEDGMPYLEIEAIGLG